MLRNVVVVSGLGLAVLGCGSGVDERTPPIASSREAFTQTQQSSYAEYEPSCGACAAGANQWSTQWVVRGGGSDTSCSPLLDYLCLDDARFTSVWRRSDGTSFALGSFNGTLEIGADTHQSGTSIHNYPFGWSVENAFIAKISESGQILWTRAFVGTDNTWMYAVAEDSSGNIYITGTFADPLTIGSTTLDNVGSVDVFVAKLDPNGNPIWATSGGSLDYDYASDLMVTSTRVYIAGTTGANSNYGPVALTSHGGGDFFVASLDSNTGAWVWGESAGGAGADSGRAIARAADGSLLVSGSFSGISSLFGQAVVSEGETDGFVAKVSPTSGLSWLNVLAGSGQGSIDAIASSSSAIAVAGWGTGVMEFGSTTASSVGEDDGFAAGISQSGTVHFIKTMGGSGTDRARGVAIDASGTIHVTGSFSETAIFDVESLVSAGESDVFLAEIEQGQWSQLSRAGGPGNDSPRRIASLGKDKLWVTGRVVAGNATFGTSSATVDGIADAFLWHLHQPDCEYEYR